MTRNWQDIFQRGQELSPSAIDQLSGIEVDLATALAFVQGSVTSLFNVQSPPYSAVGNGVVDDTTKIQAALTAANAAGGGTVFVPRGTYKITASLVIYSNTRLWLDPNATLSLAASSSCNMIHNAAWVAGSGRDSNIEIVGGTWAAGNNGGGATAQALYAILLQRVDQVSLHDLKVTSSGGKYAIDLYACTNFRVDQITFACNSDGVHVEGASSNGRITNIFGSTGDDSVALTAANYTANQNGDLGDITDVLIENVSTTVSGGKTSVTVLAGSNAGGGTAYNCKRIRVAGVLSSSSGPAVRIGGDSTNASTQGGNIYDVQVSHVINTGSGPGVYVMNMGASTEAAGLEFSHISNQAAKEAVNLDASSSALTVRDVTIRNCQFSAPNVGVSPIKVSGGAVVEHLSVSDIYYAFATSTFLVLIASQTATTVKHAKFARIRLNGSTFGGGLIAAGPSFSLVLTVLHAEDITIDECGYPLGDLATTTSIYARGISCPSGNISALVFNRTGCSLTFREVLGLDASNLFALGSSGTVAGAHLVGAGRKVALAYSASMTPDLIKGSWQTITVTDGVAMTINAPTNPPAAQNTELTIEVLNSSGGAMGVITWNAAFVFAGATWANPASTKKRFARFEWNGSNWLCTGFSTLDY